MPSRRNGASARTTPRYQRVADELMKRIGAGKYPVGAYLPTEMELCEQYGISRHTVREALRRLRDAGLISSRRRVGTEVVARTSRASYRQPTNTISDFLQYGEETQISVLQTKRVAVGAALAAQLECKPGETWLRVSSLRTVPGDARPLCLTTAYVDAHLRGIDRQLASLTGPISAMLEREYGLRIARIEQVIQATRLGKRESTLLGAEEGGPALRAIRRYYDGNDELIELSNAIHPADRFTYVTSLVRH